VADPFVRLDNRALQQVLSGSQGPVARHLIERSEAVRQEAKRRVGYDTTPGRDTSEPHLRDVIVKRFVSAAGSFAVLVGVWGKQAQRALWHHEGTGPHEIRPRNATVLRFRPKGSAAFVFARIVHHPGTRANKFLTDAVNAIRSRP
jgi:hypothetical protein